MKWVFWGAAGVIAYTYAGYAAWLWLRAWLRPWPVRRGICEPMVSVVMVVRNEGTTLEKKIRNLLELDYAGDRLEIVIVSDGSTDGTDSILQDASRDSRVRVLCDPIARGKASGLVNGINLAKGEIVVFTDVRQMIEPGALRALVKNFADTEVGGVSGELMLGNPESGESSQGSGLYWRIEKIIRTLEASSGSVVGATGAFYGVRRELLRPLPEGTILDDVYLPMEVVRQGKRVVFEPEARAWDSPNLGADREFRRKVRTLGGNYQLLQIAPWLLTSSNPIRFEYISHKLLRLVIPFALLAALIASAFIAEPLYRGLLLAQLVFYVLSLVGLARLKVGLISGVVDGASTFVVLNTAAVVAFANFVSGRRVKWTP